MDDLTEKTVTCHTEGCENQDISITFFCADRIVCGVCEQEITDVVEAS